MRFVVFLALQYCTLLPEMMTAKCADLFAKLKQTYKRHFITISLVKLGMVGQNDITVIVSIQIDLKFLVLSVI